MDNFTAWQARVDSAPFSAEAFMTLFRNLQANRGSVVESTGPDGNPLPMFFYRDIDVTVRFFPQTADGLSNLLTVTHPRFTNLVLAIHDDPSGTPQIAEYRPGKWYEHLKSISDRPRASWHDLLAFDTTDPAQREIIRELLLAGRLLAEFQGSSFTAANRPGLKPGVELKELRLSSCILHLYRTLDEEPLLLHVMTEFDEQFFSAMYTSRGWDCTGMIAGPWIDEVLLTFEALDRELAS